MHAQDAASQAEHRYLHDCEGLGSHAAGESPMQKEIIPRKNPSKSFLARVLGLAEHKLHPHDCYGLAAVPSMSSIPSQLRSSSMEGGSQKQKGVSAALQSELRRAETKE